MRRSFFSFVGVAVISIAGSACKPAEPAQGPAPLPESPPAATSAPAPTAPAVPSAEPGPSPGEASGGGLVPNNPALGKALVGVWTPDASGSIPASTQTVLERELLRSYLYVDIASDMPPLHQGNLLVYTSEAGLLKSNGPGARAKGSPPAELFELALRMKVGIHLQHKDDETSVFTVFTQDDLEKLLARAKKGS